MSHKSFVASARIPTVTPPYSAPSLPPGRPPVHCAVRPECAGCNHPAHGFICHFGDGTCLRYTEKITEEHEYD